MTLPVAIALLFIAAASAPRLVKRAGPKSVWILAVAPATLFAYFAAQLGEIEFDRVLSISYPWVPELSANIDLRLDGLSLLFALMITGVGTLIALYAGGYLPTEQRGRGRFYAYLYLFMGSMLGLVLSDNLILLFVFWELTSISSYLLIGFNHESAESRRKALQALLVTGIGGVALLAGFVLLANAADSFRLSEIVAQGNGLATEPLAQIALPLLLLGAFTKSAQFPFQFWLPNAMAAPTPVSAYLHSATMVKAGVFLLFKLHPVFGQTTLWGFALVACGGITFLLGTISGLFQRDLKRILAYTTMAVLGMLVMLIGLGSEMALKSALLFMLGHALYKATLFMAAGNIDHATGTRDVRILGGLRGMMPLTALAAGLAAFSKGGFPPLVGFLGKEYIYKTSSAFESFAPWITAIALVGNALLLALAFKAGIHPFWAKAAEPNAPHPWSRFLPQAPHEANPLMIAGPLILAAAGLLFGLFPQSWSDTLIAPALSASVGTPTNVSIALWQGFNVPLLLSVGTVVAGLFIYAIRQTFWRREGFAQTIQDSDTENIYHYLFEQFVSQSKRLTGILQNGSLRFYLWVILLSAGAFAGYKLIALGPVRPSFSLDGINLFHIALFAAMMASIYFAATARSLIRALAGLGLTGYGIALLFAINGAPDLAITQVIVETLGVALLLFATMKLPAFRIYSSPKARIADAGIALACGAIVFALSVKATQLQLSPAISSQLADWSYEMAKGKNVVNVILVDFRALDTFGEIVVLGIAAIGVAICLNASRPTRKRAAAPPNRGSSPILLVGARLLLPACVAFSLLALYRGHNEPGGGFIGGLLCASGFVLYALANGAMEANRLLRLQPLQWIGLGLLVALGSGFFGPIAGKPFMTGLWLPDFSLPVIGKVHLGTPLLFDLGVYFVVLGFATSVTFAFLDALVPERIKPQAPRSKRQPLALTRS